MAFHSFTKRAFIKCSDEIMQLHIHFKARLLAYAISNEILLNGPNSLIPK